MKNNFGEWELGELTCCWVEPNKRKLIKSFKDLGWSASKIDNQILLSFSFNSEKEFYEGTAMANDLYYQDNNKTRIMSDETRALRREGFEARERIFDRFRDYKDRRSTKLMGIRKDKVHRNKMETGELDAETKEKLQAFRMVAIKELAGRKEELDKIDDEIWAQMGKEGKN